MISIRHAVSVLLTVLALTASCSSPVSETPTDPVTPANTLTEEEKAAGWKLLFDGQSLAGWEDPASEDPPGDSWTVVDGCIRATNDPQIREDLPTLETFGDFELSWEWKISQGGNSGLKYRIQDRVYLAEGLTNPDAKRFEDTVDYELTNRGTKRTDITPGEKNEEYVVAFEYQLIDNDGHPDARASLDRSAGAMYAMAAPTEQVTRPVGEWNESRIVLRGMHVEHWLNGTKIVEADLDSEQVLAGVKKRWTTDSPVYQMLAEQPQRKTPIVLQNHNDEAWFRSIKIREF